MRGLICKDFFVMKKQLGYYLAFFVVYGVLAVTGVFPASILSALVAVIAMMVPMSSIAYDDRPTGGGTPPPPPPVGAAWWRPNTSLRCWSWQPAPSW